MQMFLAFLLMVLSGTVSAESFRSKVAEVVPGETTTEKHLVKWSNGRVTYVSAARAEELLRTVEEKRDFEVIVDEESNTVHKYEPTVMESEQSATDLLRKMRKPSLLQWNIQCYNMAHVRAYEAWKNHGVTSMKAFLFFTDSYIRKYGHKWWFHVTPMVYVKHNGKVEERILDKEWAKKAVTVKEWTDVFIKPKTACPVIKKYSEYENNQDTNHCYLMPVKMFYWQPLHLAELERGRSEMTEFNMSQVRTAYARDM